MFKCLFMVILVPILNSEKSWDYDCLSDERCIGNVCKLACDSDSECSKGEICENKLCTSGCRTDFDCHDNQACIEGLCKSPCNTTSVCGTCADCKVINHKVNCGCPSGFIGNPLINCAKPILRCDGSCPCDLDSGYCIAKCSSNSDCSCGEVCKNGKCATKCSVNTACPLGHICKNGLCSIGCRHDKDCPSDRSCINGKCKDSCSRSDNFSCGKNAICRVSNHIPSCSCPDGYQGDPATECVRYGCVTDGDCEPTKKCSSDKVCRNPCLEVSVCGTNAECNVVNRNVQCSCPVGYRGNAQVECKAAVANKCTSNPCGENTRCVDVYDSFECTCLPGCSGDPLRGCICEASRTDYCKNTICGTNAQCRSQNSGDPQCYCPPEFPIGDPNVHCQASKLPIDCRTSGCGKGALCEKDNEAVYKCACPVGSSGNPDMECVLDTECVNDVDCTTDKTCINGHCIDGCSLHGACGTNALCRTMLHRIQCTCPRCHSGQPEYGCTPLAHCDAGGGPARHVICAANKDCASNEMCVERECVDPCATAAASAPLAASALSSAAPPAPIACEPLKKCETRNHKPICICKYGFHLTENGELTCAPEQMECQADDECSSSFACAKGKCRNPCIPDASAVGVEPKPLCEANRTCAVINHKPVCLCMDDCNPSLTVCLRDAGCPSDTVCRNYECVDPCVNVTCPENAFCVVEQHVPVCKFCPKGWRHDTIASGCVRSKEPIHECERTCAKKLVATF